MSTVLREFADHVEIDPWQRKWSTAIPVNEVVNSQRGSNSNDWFHESGVLDQAEQGGLGGHQSTARLFLGDTIKAATERGPVIVQERFELVTKRSSDGRQVVAGG